MKHWQKPTPLTQFLRELQQGETATVSAPNNIVRATLSNLKKQGFKGSFEVEIINGNEHLITRL